ncbi:uncharacterized protein BX663DRAFT_507116 [Cokeromyces recurvatus]|uniref:uncharacterized protein n=1 Tax=Cokeromyces recurvatus TaxID=90255 RepID=UPI00221FFD0A|nr:uncharacterized protein BX663DRAFT_507116 [Cokeromyces recurvatus]KAI7903622.1 hypothetical protein BX663DRAFT_507116 [Cokeromyces recurvatus]
MPSLFILLSIFLVNSLPYLLLTRCYNVNYFFFIVLLSIHLLLLLYLILYFTLYFII